MRARLVEDPEEDWRTAGPGGREITFQYLRERFANELDPPGSTRETRLGPRGYAFSQFTGAFARYVGSHPALDSHIEGVSQVYPAHPAHRAQKFRKTSKSAAKAAPDVTPDGAPDAAMEKPSKSAKNPSEEPDAPDAPDEPGSYSLRGERGISAVADEPALDLSPPPIPKYEAGTFEQALAEEIHRLHDENPKRSLAWLSKKTGQPKSVVQAILQGDGTDLRNPDKTQGDPL